MHKRFALSALIAAATLAACGGGGSGGGLGGSYGGGGPIPQPSGNTAPSSSPNLPIQETVAGSAAWVDSTSHRTLYFLDVDTATGSACTGGCLNLWPVLAPSSGAQGQGTLSIISRSDATSQQWAFQGHPLYFYAGDSGADQANGEGVAQSGGHWHVARPASSGGGGGGGGY